MELYRTSKNNESSRDTKNKKIQGTAQGSVMV